MTIHLEQVVIPVSINGSESPSDTYLDVEEPGIYITPSGPVYISHSPDLTVSTGYRVNATTTGEDKFIPITGSERIYFRTYEGNSSSSQVKNVDVIYYS